MKVIVAGLPKTGTKSMTEALRQLGYSVYDYMENLYYLEGEWEQIFRGGKRKPLFQKMYHDLDAVVDLPSCYFWADIHKAFPESKIILTVRDTEDVWLNSLLYHMKRLDELFLVRIMQFLEIMINRQCAVLLTSSYKLILGIDRAVWRKKTLMDKEMLKMKYRNHNSDIIKNAPPDKLLIFNCKEGWEPLCKFLGKPVPEQPFPHVNIHADIMDSAPRSPLARKYQREVAGAVFLKLSKYAIMIYLAFCIVGFFF